MTIKRGFSASIIALAVLACSPALAGTVAAGFDTNVALGPNDDGSTGAIATGLSLNYFGTTYTNTFISNNGYLTFNGGQGSYTSDGLGADYNGQPIIAAFFGDVDTRAAGTVNYGTGTYNGHMTFGATWNGVGYYSNSSDKLNTFQILLSDRSDIAGGDFDIYLNYDQVQWETGSASGGANGFGGISGAVGFNAGNGNAAGSYYELPGSRLPGTFFDTGTAPLITTTNDGVPGQLLFQVRGGSIVTPPVGGVPEPATWTMMLVGFGLSGFAMRSRKSALAA